MALPKPTLKELYRRINADFEARLTSGNRVLPVAVIRVLSAVWAGVIYLLYGYSTALLYRLLPFSDQSDTVREWAAMSEMYPTPATFGQFNIHAIGTEGTTIDAGTEYQSADGYIYTVNDPATIVGGSADIIITAVDSGSAPNLTVGDVVELVSAVAGIDAAAAVTAVDVVGYDEETDAQLYARWQSFIANTSTGGNDNDYKRWAREVSGVDRVWTFRHWSGLGTVGVMFTVYGEGSAIIPNTMKIDEVRAKLALEAPLDYLDIIVFAPGLVELNPTISIFPDTPAIRAATGVELSSLIKQAGGPDISIPNSQLQEAISIVPGEIDHTLVSPTGPFYCGPTSVPILGEITWE